MAVSRATLAPARLLSGLRWLTFGLALGLASLFIAWRSLAAVDFAYPLLYDVLSIDATIARYAPRNEVRPGFQYTDRAERERLFAAIVDAVRHDGRGLGTLVYHAPNGRILGRLLTPPEIQHLRDVARLVGAFERAGWLALLAVAGLLAAAVLRRERMPPLWTFGAGAFLVLGAGTLITFLLGPVHVFYWLHRHIFPPGHEWFFYYEQSLMSTMMQAPNLFGWIAVFLLALAVLVFAVALLASRLLLERTRVPRAGGGT